VTEPVVLVPGLWMPGAAMAFMAARLSRLGYGPKLFGYSGRSPLEGNIARLASFARESLRGRPAHFVGHSLGGVLIFETLNRHPGIRAASATLIGAPIAGCFAGRRLGQAGIGRWMMGACGALWEPHAAAWKHEAPLGIIAGTVPWGLGRALLGPMSEANDGVVCVSETAAEGMAAQALVPLGHSPLIVSPRVVRLVGRFLASGRFE
jgi:pimeloyl-ACP methyl ester carboxylesterase